MRFATLQPVGCTHCFLQGIYSGQERDRHISIVVKTG
jgi:hypothetical protein